MKTFRLALLGCLVVGLAGCGKVKEAAAKKVEQIAEKQEKARAKRLIVGRWRVKEKGESIRWIEFTKDGKLMGGGIGPDDEAPQQGPATYGFNRMDEVRYEVDGDKLTVSFFEKNKPSEMWKKPATLDIKKLEDNALVLEGEKVDLDKGVLAGLWSGEYTRLRHVALPKEVMTGAWEVVEGDGTACNVVLELGKDGKLKLTGKTDKGDPYAQEGTWKVDGKKFVLDRKGKELSTATIKKLTYRTLLIEEDGKTRELRKKRGHKPSPVGQWQAVKSDTLLSLEMSADGSRFFGNQKNPKGGPDGIGGPQGKYGVVGDKIKVQYGSEPQQHTWTIKLVTEYRLIVVDPAGKTHEFKRKLGT